MQSRSYVTCLTDFVEEVTKMIDEDWTVDVVYMDFSMTFDKVPGRVLF